MIIEVAVMKKYLSMGCLILMMLGLLSGCAQNTPKQEVTPVTPTEEEETYQSGPQVELYAYDAEEDQQYVTICELAPGETITPENIIKAYQTQVMEGVYGTAVNVNEVKLVKGTGQGHDKLYIDFKASDVQSLGLGSGSEGNYFGDLAESITANIPDITEIYYTMDGGDFITGHLWFSKDEPFWYEHEEPIEE